MKRQIPISLALMLLSLAYSALGQQSDSTSISQRILMPAVQIGYIDNLSNELKGGVIVQTSIEYQTLKGVFFRINYDTFTSDYELNTNQGAFEILSGELNISELLFGIGYRKVIKKHNFLMAIQPGYRFYGYPKIEEQESVLTIQMDNRNVQMGRYTIGYEYEIDTSAFLSFELFGSQVWKKENFWTDNQWATGFTIGITSVLF